MYNNDYLGLDGVTVGIPDFGVSAPGKVLDGKLGLTVQHIADEVLHLLPWRQP